MEDFIDYGKAKQEAKEFYREIRRVWCPALNDYVKFGNDGLRHLMRKRGVFRPKSEQKRRFALLRDTTAIIANPTMKASQNEKISLRSINRRGKKLVVSSAAKFWKLTGRNENQVIKVVIRQFEGGKKEFLSVYGKIRKK
jgi:hypothetical protein